ncbi:MAG: glutamate--tRNA ligase family protein, partial [Bacteroidota bacterium]
MKARIAPTPSGYLHQGNLANFLLNTKLAGGADLLLRIDDLDRARFRQEYLEDIFRCVRKLGLPINEGPTGAKDFARLWSQEHRMDHYANALNSLR